jgi:histidinol-phosphate aminotransferase
MGGEAAFAQGIRNLPRAAPPGAVWLNANENPEGPPAVSIEAMQAVLAQSNRYFFQEFGEFNATVARSERLSTGQVLAGAGSSEIIHAAIDAFTSPDNPLVLMQPTYELAAWIAQSAGRKVVPVPLSEGYYADVKRMAAEAASNRAGLIYLCNPNNPTSALTPQADIDWLVENLPGETVLLVDEAYIHFATTGNAIEHVRKNRNVVVARTFSKIYGMAGLRCGFACARPDLIEKMTPFRDNVLSIVTQRSVSAALADAPAILKTRRQKFDAVRADLCAWLRSRELRYIEPQANFVMFDIRQEVGPFAAKLAARGVMVGRPFPPLTTMLRLTLGTPDEMEKFKQAFEAVWT